jgi:hypothetical protein
MNKTANLNIRIEPSTKAMAENEVEGYLYTREKL